MTTEIATRSRPAQDLPEMIAASRQLIAAGERKIAELRTTAAKGPIALREFRSRQADHEQRLLDDRAAGIREIEQRMIAGKVSP